ncbi:hypothetical protein COLO4_35502 [Corchorus olitorius]|uniref:Uncharacterized protein n=1 Tax=Corchorus olitorius TaxID=93759 RepID=A0A1R3GGB0_9ROSI|nr:hypothetical protein COLO4_35502 [Corchorus olitorius]
MSVRTCTQPYEPSNQMNAPDTQVAESQSIRELNYKPTCAILSPDSSWAPK